MSACVKQQVNIMAHGTDSVHPVDALSWDTRQVKVSGP